MRRLTDGIALTAVLLAAGLTPLAPAPLHAATLFGLVDTGELFASSDQGANWTVRATLPLRDAVGLGAGATASDLFLASRSGVVYRSSDAGYGWSAVGAVSASDVVDLQLRTNLSLVLLTASGTIYRSTDNGANFTAVTALTGSEFVSLGLAAQDRLYVLTRTGDVAESVDGGTNWTFVGTLPVSDAVRLRAIGNSLYVVTGTGDIYRSTDRGVSWSAIGTLSQVGMTAMTRGLGTLIVSTAGGEVATSADGAAWTWQGAINQLTVMALGVDLPATTSAEPRSVGVGLQLAPPAPNPLIAGEMVTLSLVLPAREIVAVELYDPVGRRVASRAPEALAAGPVTLRWQPTVRSAGLNFLRITTGSGAAAVARVAVLR